MKSTTFITLDMQRPNYLTVYAVQDDQLTRRVSAQLTDGGNAWTPPSGALVTIRYHKPDGTGGWYDTLEDGSSAYTINGSTVDIGLAAQCLTVPGTVLTEISFYTRSAERLSAFRFRLEVEKNVLTDAEVESSDYYNILSSQIAAVLDASANPPKIDPTTRNWLIWNETAGQYVDSGFSSVGQTGPAPQITRQTRSWQRSSSGTTIPSGTWSSTPLSGVPGQFIWTKNEIVYNNGDTETLYLAAYQGNDGQGAPGSQLPLMDGVASAGRATAYSREDHVHPSGVTYSPGSQTVIGAQCFGFLTGSATRARIVIHPPKMLQSNASATVTAVESASIRTSEGGYIGGNAVDLTSYIGGSGVRGGDIYVELDNPDGWGFTNNTVLAGQVNITFTVR